MVSIVGSRHPVTKFYLATLPERLKIVMNRSLRSINVKPGRSGHGQYDHPYGRIIIDHCPNLWYFFEVLGHEIGHLTGAGKWYRAFGSVSDAATLKENLCDQFSEFILYGTGELSGIHSSVYGKRDPEVLSALHRQISRYDALTVNEKGYNKEKRHLQRGVVIPSQALSLELALSR